MTSLALDQRHAADEDDGRIADAAAASPVDVAADDCPETRRKTARAFDQFYTQEKVAIRCMTWLREVLEREGENLEDEAGVWIEPSAGTGIFLRLLPSERRIGVDIAPPSGAPEEIEKDDFLKWSPREDQLAGRPVIVVGNPPFGRNGSLALQFMARAARYADYICFILPRTFMKQATKDKVSARLEHVETLSLEDDSFTHLDKSYKVPCCFQIWRQRAPHEGERPRELRSMEHPDFEIKPWDRPHEADFAFQRVGAQAGQVSREGRDKSWKSHYFIKDVSGTKDVFKILDEMDWTEIKRQTAGNPSIGKCDLVEAYVKKTKRPATPPLSHAARRARNAAQMSMDV